MHTHEPPPENAVVLFDGTDLSAWHKRGNEPATWEVADGILSCNATGNIISNELFEDCRVHVEFFIPAEGPGNSGVYLQGRYEVQVLAHDRPDLPGVKMCGAIYNLHPPLQQVEQERESWQSFDIVFRAPRTDDDCNKTESARITVFHNGKVIQNNVEIPAPTGGHLDEDEGTPGPLMLQDHGGNPVSFRNVWAVHL
ncbi:MAG: 3-keto-disaccharide hydrolase [Armatimonadota bacterium]